jgi:HPt (histidine-containing phosphotransfer) domain-containing protein
MNKTMHAARPAEAEGAIDFEQLDRSTSGDRALQLELLALFDRQAKALLAEIETMPDLSARQAAAHTLKGAALGVGATAVADAAQFFEESAGEGRLECARSRLQREIAAARDEIADILARD